MKTSILVAAIVASALAAPIASAQDRHVHDKPGMGMHMEMEKHMSQMQEGMKTMQQQMGKIRATTDPQERQKLMQEHMQAMQENMKTMRGMGGPMMKGTGEHGGMMMGGKKGGKKHGMAGGELMQHHAMMEKRMDMMQMMMEHMMQHDQAMESMPAK